MSTQNLQTLKGFRDFLPDQKRVRDLVMAKIKETFELFGFEPLETPTLEYASLLLGKYGTEADKLVFKFADRGGREVALRYDQTVPTARVLAQYQNQLPKFFRRYQMQPAFRAEKPQKGRFREFTQCDIDIFGSKSPVADAEILACSYMAYKNLGFKNVSLRVNSREVLISTLTPFATETVSVFSIIQSVDKLDKLSQQEVIDELIRKG
jgi:histidyl-tRNA synthetase